LSITKISGKITVCRWTLVKNGSGTNLSGRPTNATICGSKAVAAISVLTSDGVYVDHDQDTLGSEIFFERRYGNDKRYYIRITGVFSFLSLAFISCVNYVFLQIKTSNLSLTMYTV
jgi:hypothetical protein